MGCSEVRRASENRSAQAAMDARLLHLHEQGVPVAQLAHRFGINRLTAWERIDRACMNREIAAYACKLPDLDTDARESRAPA